LQKQEVYYFVRNKTHFLTAWLPATGAFTYDTDAALANFGKCLKPDDSYQYKNPGSCVAGGGRVGYSTKLVARDLLINGTQPLGGENSTKGKILNPPTND
jgi:hypothetical protein